MRQHEDVIAEGTETGAADGEPPTNAKLGTFIGVYLPTVLTILGVMMYLRVGAVVGTVGLTRALLIIAVANVITLITALSFSAVATNIRVGVGGAYYIISRSLGLEVGGAIGLPLFLSQVVSVTLYAYGLAEAARYMFPALPVQETAFCIVIAVAALAYRGPGIALRTQVPLLVFIGISMAALGAGVAWGEQAVTPGSEVIIDPGLGFWGVFAVFFPAVTGVMAGLGLSGDLRQPNKAIPRGSLSATLTGFAIYMFIPFLLLAGATEEVLRTDQLVWARIAPLGVWLIFPGLLGAIFSSAVGSILGAPRTLQALALDRIVPRWLAREKDPEKGPVLGLVVSTALALGAVLLGDLNAVALVVSMFFLTVYGTVNIVAAIEGLAGDPSWRPKIGIPWPVSLLGGLACIAVMFLIHPVAAVAAMLVEVVLWIFIARREHDVEWGDARRGAYEALIRWSLVRLGRHPMKARSWRPHLLVFASDVANRLPLIRWGIWFAQKRGVVTVCELIRGDLLDGTLDIAARRSRAVKILDRERLVAFAEVNVVRDLISGITDVTQANGIAGLQSNTIVLGWPDENERMAKFLEVTRRLQSLHVSVIVGRIRGDGAPPRTRAPEIHIWWRGRQHNGDLMLLLAHLTTRNAAWRRARIRVMSLVAGAAARAEMTESLERLMAETRIEAEAHVLPLPADRSVPEEIRVRSAVADVVFMGLLVPEPGEELGYTARLAELSRGLRTVFFVRNSSLFTGELV